MNLREARPALLVDINRIPGLGVIRKSQGRLYLGATVRQAALERSRIIARHWPLLAQAVRHVGHPATRSRGTVGGSAAFGDPRAQLPLALAALDARVRTSRRTLTVREPLEPGELLLEIEVPPLPPGTRTKFAQFSYGVAVAVAGDRTVTTPVETDHQRALVEFLLA